MVCVAAAVMVVDVVTALVRDAWLRVGSVPVSLLTLAVDGAAVVAAIVAYRRLPRGFRDAGGS